MNRYSKKWNYLRNQDLGYKQGNPNKRYGENFQLLNKHNFQKERKRNYCYYVSLLK